jgi:predicted transcriptional regulator
MNAIVQGLPTRGLPAAVAADVMVANPVSLRADATIEEAMALFVDKAIDAAPVIDDGGRPIGVISRSDVFIHLLESVRRNKHMSPAAAELIQVDPAPVSVADLMTPTVFAVGGSASLTRIVGDMVGLHVHRLFVVDDDGVLIGVITAMDVLKLLHTGNL